MDEDKELEFCPFCGNNEPSMMIREGKNGFRDYYYVLCDYNDGGCGASSGWYHTREEAAWSWNRRDGEPMNEIPIG